MTLKEQSKRLPPDKNGDRYYRKSKTDSSQSTNFNNVSKNNLDNKYKLEKLRSQKTNNTEDFKICDNYNDFEAKYEQKLEKLVSKKISNTEDFKICDNYNDFEAKYEQKLEMLRSQKISNADLYTITNQNRESLQNLIEKKLLKQYQWQKSHNFKQNYNFVYTITRKVQIQNQSILKKHGYLKPTDNKYYIVSKDGSIVTKYQSNFKDDSELILYQRDDFGKCFKQVKQMIKYHTEINVVALVHEGYNNNKQFKKSKLLLLDLDFLKIIKKSSI